MNYSEQVPSFPNMLGAECFVYDEFARPNLSAHLTQSHEEENAEVISISSQDFSSQKVKEKRQRTRNFSKQEDELLISAWQNVSFDPITGVDQKNETYWQRVHSYFMKHKDFQSDRTSCSLMHRWSVIQLAVNKFQGYYNQVEGKSGCSEADKINNAKDMYKNLCKHNFSLEHCWNLLRHLPKWNIEFGTKKAKIFQKDSPKVSSPSTPDCEMLGNSAFERPIGRKAAKEIQKKRKKLDNEFGDYGGAAILEKMMADQNECRKQRNEHLKEMRQLAKDRDEREKRRAAAEQDEADAKIMAMDTSSMGAIEVEYFNSRKQEIIERRRNLFAK
ncbi:glutathione S-transferase T3 isoform X2 [Daucus carota subsp. sativus]